MPIYYIIMRDRKRGTIFVFYWKEATTAHMQCTIFARRRGGEARSGEAARRGSARQRGGEAGGKKSLRHLYHQFGLIGAQSKSGEAARRRGENCLAASPPRRLAKFFYCKKQQKQQKNSKFIWRGGKAISASPPRCFAASPLRRLAASPNFPA